MRAKYQKSEMIDCQLRHIGVYRLEEQLKQRLCCPWIYLYVSGASYCEWHAEGGWTATLPPQQPFLSVMPAGVTLHGEFGIGRENWVLMVEGLPVRMNTAGAGVELGYLGGWVPVPPYVEIKASELADWQQRLVDCKQRMAVPLPRHQLLNLLDVAALIRRIIDHEPERSAMPLPRRLRALIDEDIECRHTLESLCARLGCSVDHARVLFRAEYHVTPKAYQWQRRMARAMALLTETNRSIADIAGATGFCHSAHFGQAFRRHMGMSPRAARRRYWLGLAPE